MLDLDCYCMAEVASALYREQQNTEAEEVEDFQPIDKLQQLGINAGEQTCSFVMCLHGSKAIFAVC